jgi:hypothetical protein
MKEFISLLGWTTTVHIWDFACEVWELYRLVDGRPALSATMEQDMVSKPCIGFCPGLYVKLYL